MFWESLGNSDQQLNEGLPIPGVDILPALGMSIISVYGKISLRLDINLDMYMIQQFIHVIYNLW